MKNWNRSAFSSSFECHWIESLLGGMGKCKLPVEKMSGKHQKIAAHSTEIVDLPPELLSEIFCQVDGQSIAAIRAMCQ